MNHPVANLVFNMKKKSPTDNVFLGVLRRLPDFLALSFCWLMCCIPVITIGSATIALYDTIVQCFHHGQEHTGRHFFTVLRRELGRGILLTLVWGAAGAALSFGCLIMFQMALQSSLWMALSAVYLLTLLLPLGVLCWLIPIQSRFAYSFAELHRTALQNMLTRLPYTVAVLLVLVLGITVLVMVPYLVLVLPAIICWMQSLFIEKALDD